MTLFMWPAVFRMEAVGLLLIIVDSLPLASISLISNIFSARLLHTLTSERPAINPTAITCPPCDLYEQGECRRFLNHPAFLFMRQAVYHVSKKPTEPIHMAGSLPSFA